MCGGTIMTNRLMIFARKFVGIFYGGEDNGLVAVFEDKMRGRSMLTTEELCDRIEAAINSKNPMQKEILRVDRFALVALIEAQRRIADGRELAEDYPPISPENTVMVQ